MLQLRFEDRYPLNTSQKPPLYIVLTGPISSTIFWDITQACHLLSRWFLAELILSTLKMGRYVPPKRRLTLNGLHGVISQKIALFITTAVRTSNRLTRNLGIPI
jgi:hypothetical protein